MKRVFPLLALALSACTSAAAQPEQPTCATVAEPWRNARSAVSAHDAAGAAQVRFAPGEAVRFSLHPDGEVAYLTLAQGAGEAESFGGMATFSVEMAGTYSVALSEPSWVDVVQGGKPTEAVRFGPGAACSGIRKTVAFRLEPGEHVLEMSGNTTPDLAVLITPAP